MSDVVHTSRIEIHKHAGPHRTAQVEGLDGTIHFSVHSGIKSFYQNKYGMEISAPQHPATLDYMIAAVAG